MDEVFILWHTGRLSEQDFRVALKQKKLMVDDDFNKLLKNIPARKKLLVADACHSGTIQKDLLPAGMKKKSVPLFDLTASDKIELALMSPKRGAPEPVRYGTDSEAIMAACLDSQSSYEDTTRKHGLFTYFLLEAVKQGASNLQAAFQNAQNLTVKETRPKGPGAASASQEQRPSLTDPHGFVKLFGFPR
jgi:hypothetical protein